MRELPLVLAAFKGLAIAPTSERSFHDWCRERLELAGLEYRSEVFLTRGPVYRRASVAAGKLGKSDRIDLLVGKLGIELKIDGSWPEVLRQLDRYADSPDIDGLLLITSRRRLVAGLPSKLRNKPLHSLCVGAF